MRLIDANSLQRLFDTLSKNKWNKSSFTSWAMAYEAAKAMVDDEVTVDAVPVVRCKDCKHGDEENGTEWIGGHAPFYCGFHGGLFDGDCYCSFAERREDDRTV